MTIKQRARCFLIGFALLLVPVLQGPAPAFETPTQGWTSGNGNDLMTRPFRLNTFPSASGTVTDSNGLRLSGALVETLNSIPPLSTTTGPTGYYYLDLSLLNAATVITVRVSKAGYKEQTSGCYTTGVTPTIVYSPKLLPSGESPTADLTVGLAGFGGGSVGRSVAGTACTSGCTASYPKDTTVTLTPGANANSVFAGWSGACSGTGGCTVTMSTAQSVTATFNLKPVWVEGASYYDTLQAANGGVASGNVIALQSGTLAEHSVLSKAVTMTLKGGYDGTFSTASGTTTLQGSLTITAGTVIVDKLAIK